jgi:hypothetical protein
VEVDSGQSEKEGEQGRESGRGKGFLWFLILKGRGREREQASKRG